MCTKEEKEVTELLLCKQKLEFWLYLLLNLWHQRWSLDLMCWLNHNCSEIKNTFLTYSPQISSLCLSVFGTEHRIFNLQISFPNSLHRIHQKYSNKLSMKALAVWIYALVDSIFKIQIVLERVFQQVIFRSSYYMYIKGSNRS